MRIYYLVRVFIFLFGSMSDKEWSGLEFGTEK